MHHFSFVVVFQHQINTFYGPYDQLYHLTLYSVQLHDDSGQFGEMCTAWLNFMRCVQSG